MFTPQTEQKTSCDHVEQLAQDWSLIVKRMCVRACEPHKTNVPY